MLKHNLRFWAAAARAIGLRAAVWGGVAVLVLATFGDIRPLVLPRWALSERSAGPPAAPQPAPQAREAAKGTPPDAAAWPQLRGPNHDGCSAETDLAERWPADGPPVLWVREIGCGYSGFAAVGDRVYTQTQTLYGQSVVCLEADTGRTIWQQRYDWPYDAAGMYPGPRATPTWHEGRIYYASPQGRVGCLDATDGRPLWSLNVIEQFAGQGHGFGYSCSPLVEDGLVILPVGGQGASVVALRVEDGSTVWAAGDQPASYCSALPITLAGRRCVAAFLENALAVFELRTGRLLWQKLFSHGYNEHAAQPLYREPDLMITNPFRGGAELFRLRLDVDAASCRVIPAGSLSAHPVTKRQDAASTVPAAVAAESVWSSVEFSNDVASSVLLRGQVYGFDLRDVQAKPQRPSRGQFKCLDFLTGKVRWASDRPGHASVLAADSKLLLWSDAGRLTLARASPDGYSELGRADVLPGEICWTAPALCRGRLFLRTPTRAACVFVGSPDSAAARSLPATRAASITAPWRIDWNWLLGGEREYLFDPPGLAELIAWYAAALLGVFLPAMLLALAARWLVSFRGAGVGWDKRSAVPPTATGTDGGTALRLSHPTALAEPLAQTVFWSACFVLSIAATSVLNRLGRTFVFTWPVCLTVAEQMALAAMFCQRRQPERKRLQLVSLLAGLGFVAAALLYFHACRQLGLAIQWCFLLGFVPSLPLAIPAARLLARRPRLLRDALLAAAVYSLFFWSAGGYMLWRGFR